MTIQYSSELLERLTELLGKFEDATKTVSANEDQTAGLILPIIAQIKRRLPAEDDLPMIKKCKQAMTTDFETRYSDINVQRLLELASVVYPKFKDIS